MPDELVAALRCAAGEEEAGLVRFGDGADEIALAALSNAAEQVQRRTPGHAAEAARWAPASGTSRRDGVQPAAYPPRTAPHFPARNFAAGDGTAAAGVAVLLTTRDDTPAAWLRAGQGLQSLLLRAAEDGLAAAYRTQSLQVPELRVVLRLRFCDGTHPQMLLRLGVPDGAEPTSVRRPVGDVLTEEP